MMSSVCAEKHHHKFHHSHQLYHHLTKKALRDIDIPPRKLFGRRHAAADHFPGSPDAAFSRYLPSNTADGDSGSESDDPYSSDHFRMFEFKVRKCSRSRSHDWTDCPFAHPGEKARRRDPRRYNYNGTICSDFRKGSCPKGDACEFSHGVFECWLHPSRYRTEACKDGKNCKRKVCFFAHTSRQLRILPEILSPPGSPRSGGPDMGHVNHCCPFCHSMPAGSPTSTLMAHVTPPASPPFSPEFSRFRALDGMNYKEAMADLMATFDNMNVAADLPPPPVPDTRSMPWLDMNSGVEQDQTQFLPPPSVQSPIWGPARPTTVKFGRAGFSRRNLMEDNRYNNNASSSGGPDLDWVNDLLT